MAVAPKVPHLVGPSGGAQLIMLLADEYSTIGQTCGVTKLTGAPPDGARSSTLRDALATGNAFHVTVSYKTSAGARKTSKVIMAGANIQNIHALVGQSFNSSTISSAYLHEHITLG